MSDKKEQDETIETYTIHAPETARKMNEPVSPEEADKNLRGFFDELYALRVKYHLPDVYAVIRTTIAYPDKTEGEKIGKLHIGNEMYAEAMAAWAMGYEMAQREKKIARLLAGKSKSQK